MTVSTIQNPKYENKASKAIDDVLRKIFGEKATLIIYEYIEKNHSIRQDEIVEKIDDFVDALRELLSSGAHPVEQKILENLYARCGVIHKPQLESFENKSIFVSQMKFLSNNKSPNPLFTKPVFQ